MLLYLLLLLIISPNVKISYVDFIKCYSEPVNRLHCALTGSEILDLLTVCMSFNKVYLEFVLTNQEHVRT